MRSVSNPLVVAAILSLTIIGPPAAAAPIGAPKADPPCSSYVVSVRILSHAKHVADAVPRIVDEADRIWRQYGVRLAYGGDERAGALQILIVDDPPDGMFAEGEGAHGLGWITFLEPGRPRNVVFLSWKRAETLLAESYAGHKPIEMMPEALLHAYLGRALGRTLAHEVGHYVLASTSHAKNGLMRASYSAVQLFDPSSGSFDLDAEQQNAVAEKAVRPHS